MLKKHIYIVVLVLLLSIALFLRTYRQDRLLGFYYDQGRDALVIWDLWHNHNLFLVGPTTGIDGILLGPFYYLLIAPAYFFGNGNPVYPANLLAVLNILGMAVLYFFSARFITKTHGLLAIFFISFSLNQIQAHRWLSNPTPLPLFSIVTMSIIMSIIHKQKSFWLWPSLGLILGLCLQLEAASAIFFLPSTLIILAINYRSVVFSKTKVVSSLGAFLLTLFPQIIFNFLHQNILVNSFTRFLYTEKSFQVKLVDFLGQRLSFYQQVFTNKFAYDTAEVLGICTILVILLAMSAKPVFSKTWSGIFIWCLVPIVTLLFYHGNNGYIWDYYFTGIYPFIFLAIGGLMIQTWNRFMAARLLVGIFIFVFLSQNLPRTYHFLIAGTDGPNHVTLGSSQDAVDWVYKDTQNQPFNVDVYVPPVISYAYDYLFLWIGTTKYGHLPQAENIPNLYTLFEQDPPHPERLAAWLSRQSGIGKVVSEERFGGITSQKRVRIP